MMPMFWILLNSFGPPLLLSSMEVSQVSPPSNQDFFQRGLAWDIPHRHWQTIPIHRWRSRAPVGELLWSQTKTHQVQQQFAFILRETPKNGTSLQTKGPQYINHQSTLIWRWSSINCWFPISVDCISILVGQIICSSSPLDVPIFVCF
jgi:hypothetical protein